MTIILALAHAFSTNKNFNPTFLYFATFIVDLNIFAAGLHVVFS